MIKFINSWAQGIILAVVIATIIEIIMPEGNNKKYVKTVIGIYILFAIIYPLITKISNKSINLNSIINSTSKEMSKYESNTIATFEANDYIEDIYKAKIKEYIKQKIKDRGYTINSLNIYIETQEDKYGQISNIDMQISKIAEIEESKTVNDVNQIEEIKVNIDKNNTVKKNKNLENEEISNDEIEILKEYLNSTYGTEKEKIYINN